MINDRSILQRLIVLVVTYKYLFAVNTRLLPSISYFIFILVACCRIDMTVTFANSNLNRVLDFIRLGELFGESINN